MPETSGDSTSNRFWAPIPRQHTFYRISQAGDLTGIEAPVQRMLAITPFVLSSAHRDFVSETSSAFDADVGGDAKVGVTPSLALDLTYNTDFAQVEVDEAQINLTRFPLFFPEKRPFFLENAGTFSVGTPQDVELFFSRRIGIDASRAEVPILGGGRLSGKVGPATIGLLNIQTDNVDSTIAPNNYSVGRIAQELPNRSRLGGIVVSRVKTDSSGDYNLTYGVDGPRWDW